MLSALMISPFNFLAKLTANFDFPEAVGPAKRIIFFDKTNLFLHQDNVFDYSD